MPFDRTAARKRHAILIAAATPLLFAAGCTSNSIIGYTASDTADTATGPTDTETDSATDTGTDSLVDTGTDSATDTGIAPFVFPFVLDFDTDDNGVGNFGDPEWRWNGTDGTYDVDVTFTESPQQRTVDFNIGEARGAGSVDWSTATAIEYRVQIPTLDGGAYCKGFVQSTQGDPLDESTWLWHDAVFEPSPGTDWLTLTLDLTQFDPALYQPAAVTKFGFQVLDPGAARPDNDTDTSAPVPLTEPANAAVRIDSITVRGANL